MKGPQLLKALVRLGEYEKMNWPQIIRQTGSHPVPCDQLAPLAEKRLREIGQDDVDELFSLRMSGNKPRIWGIRSGGVLSILWWDPEHEVCPSKKR